MSAENLNPMIEFAVSESGLFKILNGEKQWQDRCNDGYKTGYKRFNNYRSIAVSPHEFFIVALYAAQGSTLYAYSLRGSSWSVCCSTPSVIKVVLPPDHGYWSKGLFS